MNERELRRLIGAVKHGKLSRRAFAQRVLAVGLTAPMATQLLAIAGVAHAQPKSQYKPTKRGGGGLLKVLWWQGPTLAQSAFRRRHQGPGRQPRLLRAAGRLGCRRQPQAQARRLDPGPRGRHARRRRQVGGVEAEAGRHLARRQAVHRRRRRLQLGIRQGSGDRRDHRGLLQRGHGREGRPVLGDGEVRQADAVLGRRLRRHARHDDPQAPVRRLHRRQVARGADQPQAGRHRPLHVQGLQAGRPGRRRDQPELPPGQQALLRRHRDEGRRRCGLGGARRAAVGRVRLRLEHAGRGRDPGAPGEGRQGQGHRLAGRQHRAYPAQLHRSVDRGRRRAREPQDQASDAQRPGGAPGASRCWSTRIRSRSTSTAAPVPPRRTSSTTRRASSPRRPSSSSTSTRPTTSSRRPAGRRAPTASARRTARSSSSSTRPRSTSRARRPRRSSSRPPRRPASTSS